MISQGLCDGQRTAAFDLYGRTHGDNCGRRESQDLHASVTVVPQCRIDLVDATPQANQTPAAGRRVRGSYLTNRPHLWRLTLLTLPRRRRRLT